MSHYWDLTGSLYAHGGPWWAVAACHQPDLILSDPKARTKARLSHKALIPVQFPPVSRFIFICCSLCFFCSICGKGMC